MKRCARSRTRGGFSLLELMLGLGLFATLGAVLLMVVDASHDSQRTVLSKAEEHRLLRETSRKLLDELASSADDAIVVSGAAGENHTLRTQQCLESGGVAGFGVVQHGTAHLDWTVVYTVQTEISGTGEPVRRLVRRVEDDGGATQSSEVIATGLRAGSEATPGFAVVKSGDLWAVTIATEGSESSHGIEEVFNVLARN